MAVISLRVPAEVERLAEVRAFVRSACSDLDASADCLMDVVQAVDEALTNLAVHGYRGRGGPVDLVVSREGRRVVVTIEDRAPAFDPTTFPEPDLAAAAARPRPGGMGIHLMRAATDAIAHRPRPGGGNVLTLVRTLDRRRTEDG